MEKLYTKEQYAEMAQQASAQGDMLYKVQGLVEYQEKVYEYEKKIIQVPIYNDEGEIIGYEDKEVDDLTKPIMVEEVDPETGETILVHKFHYETKQKMAEYLEIKPYGYYICTQDNITDGTLNPNYEEEAAIRERQRLDALSLTPSDVERALYKAKQMDFEDLKTLIAERAPYLDMKALAIEFRANNFYRGVEVSGIRLIDTVGALLGYTSDDMDYLFEHKELPADE